MTREPSLERMLDTLSAGPPDRLPDRVLEDVFATTRGSRPLPRWLALLKEPPMRYPARVAVGSPTLRLVAISMLLIMLLAVAGAAVGGAASLLPGPSPTPAPSPSLLRTGSLPAGRWLAKPFAPGNGGHDCMEPPQAGCTEDPTNNEIGFVVTVPEGWSGLEQTLHAGGDTGPGSAGLAIASGQWLYSDPCRNDDVIPDIVPGPTVDDYANALAGNPLLDVTDPVDVTLSGYAGKYLLLQVPADISGCDVYMPWAPGIYAQGPSHRWHIWILDVLGSRVLVIGYDYPSTPAPLQAELAAIVDSIEIIPAPTVSPTIAPSASSAASPSP
jgi:hypothetical protein